MQHSDEHKKGVSDKVWEQSEYYFRVLEQCFCDEAEKTWRRESLAKNVLCGVSNWPKLSHFFKIIMICLDYPPLHLETIFKFMLKTQPKR